MIQVGYLLAVNEVGALLARKGTSIGVNEHQLDLHAVGDHALYVDHRGLTDGDRGSVVSSVPQLRKTRKIWGKLHEHTVAFHAPHDPRHRLPNLKVGGVFLPGAQKLPHADEDPLQRAVHSLDHGVNAVAYRKAVGGVGNP